VLQILRCNSNFTDRVGRRGRFTRARCRAVRLSLLPWDRANGDSNVNASIDFFGLINLIRVGASWIPAATSAWSWMGMSRSARMGSTSMGPSISISHPSTTPDITGNDYYILDLLGQAPSVGVDCLFGISIGANLAASFHAEGAGRVTVELSVTVTIDLLLTSISKNATFTLGYLELPQADLPRRSGVLTRETGLTGRRHLFLNMGPAPGIPLSESGRTAAGEDNESFVIEQLDGDASGGTIQVTAFGRTRQVRACDQPSCGWRDRQRYHHCQGQREDPCLPRRGLRK